MTSPDAPSGENIILRGLTRAVSLQQGQVRNHVRRVRQRRPNATPAQTITDLERKYLALSSSTGGSVGAIAAIPGVGTGAALTISAGESAVFLEATALFTLAVAEVHGLPTYDLERRRLVLMTVLLGSEGTALLQKAIPRTANHWGRQITRAIPMEAIRAANNILGKNFITKYGTKQGIVVLGRAIPFGIGAVIGGTANAIMADQVIRATRRAYGPPPNDWPPGSPSPDDGPEPELDPAHAATPVSSDRPEITSD